MKLSGLHHIARIWKYMEDDLRNDARTKKLQDADYICPSKKKV